MLETVHKLNANQKPNSRFIASLVLGHGGGTVRARRVGRRGHGAQGTTCEVPVISMDLYPSILEMIGVPLLPEQHTGGLSLTGLLKGGNELQRDALYWHFPHYSNHGLQSPGGAVRWRNWKLIEYFENGTVQLFNLRDDPGEQHDRAREQPDTAARLKSLLHDWRTRVGARMPGTKP